MAEKSPVEDGSYIQVGTEQNVRRTKISMDRMQFSVRELTHLLNGLRVDPVEAGHRSAQLVTIAVDVAADYVQKR